MKILLIDNGTKHLQELISLLGDHQVITVSSPVQNNSTEGYDLIVLSGSSGSSVINDKNSFSVEMNLITKSDKPIIGICFGCELIAYSFGGRLNEMPIKRQGINTINFVDDRLSNKSIAHVYEGHRWVIFEMPKDFSILARSNDGPEIIKHNSLPIVGIQFHPEDLVDHNDGKIIFTSILKSLSLS